MITRQQGFARLAAEYVAMQAAPRQPGAFSELYIRGFEAAVEVATDHREEGRTISWVRLAYDRAVEDISWWDEEVVVGSPLWLRGKTEKLAHLLVFEWGVAGQGEWVHRDFGDDDQNMPEWMENCRLGDIIGHDESAFFRTTTYWRLWPDGWEEWVVV